MNTFWALESIFVVKTYLNRGFPVCSAFPYVFFRQVFFEKATCVTSLMDGALAVEAMDGERRFRDVFGQHNSISRASELQSETIKTYRSLLMPSLIPSVIPWPIKPVMELACVYICFTFTIFVYHFAYTRPKKNNNNCPLQLIASPNVPEFANGLWTERKSKMAATGHWRKVNWATH